MTSAWPEWKSVVFVAIEGTIWIAVCLRGVRSVWSHGMFSSEGFLKMLLAMVGGMAAMVVLWVGFSLWT